MEGIPITDGRHLKELKEGEEDDEGESIDQENATPLGSVHVRIDVEEENDVENGHELGAKLDGAPRADENEHEKLQEVGIAEVEVIDMLCVAIGEHHLRPEVVA